MEELLFFFLLCKHLEEARVIYLNYHILGQVLRCDCLTITSYFFFFLEYERTKILII